MEALQGVGWVGGAMSACALIVTLVKYAYINLDGSDGLTPRAKVVAAMIASLMLVGTYAIANGLLVAANAYLLFVAVPTIGAAGAGIHTAITAAKTNTPTP